MVRLSWLLNLEEWLLRLPVLPPLVATKMLVLVCCRMLYSVPRARWIGYVLAMLLIVDAVAFV